MQFDQCTLKSGIRITEVFVKWAGNTVYSILALEQSLV
jgi:hypothetical protein